MDTKTVESKGIRVVDLPACEVASSEGYGLDEFNDWWMKAGSGRTDRFYPRDFMYHDAAKDRLVWLYALRPEDRESCPFPIVPFPGGLYAAAASIDGNDVDGGRVYGEIMAWVQATGYFGVDEESGRPVLFHVITCDAAFARMGYRQLDVYVPIA